jgi:hypothetical protein
VIKTRTLRHSLVTSHVLVSLVPLGFIAILILLFIIQSAREEFMDKIGLLAQGTRGQIQLFMDQPLTSLHTMGTMISGSETHKEDITKILNTYSHD